MKGKFITFEGTERCGKSTQSRVLYGYLKKRGHKVIYIREPGATKTGEKIRDILLHHKDIALSPRAEMLLYMAARAQIVDEVIRPALEKGKIVICDRFLDSTLAYQGYGLGIDVALIKKVGSFATHGIKPHLTILLDLPVKDGLAKCGNNKDRIEGRSCEYHQRVRKGYLKMARIEPKRIKIVKVKPDKSRTQEDIRRIIEKHVF